MSLAVPAACADSEPSHCWDNVCHLHENNSYNEKEISGGLSVFLSHTATHVHPPPPSLNHTPHKLSKHMGAVKLSLMAIYCVLCASH